MTVMSISPGAAIEAEDHATVSLSRYGFGWYYTVVIGPMQVGDGVVMTRRLAEWGASRAVRRWFREQPQPDSVYTLDKFGKRE
jgi:hypothetical protein